jgi:DNA-binding Xre family transcriptional regulator
MQDAYSKLKTVLEEKSLSTADLVRTIAEQGNRINPKSIYRLADPEEPIEKADMRVISAICQALSVGIGDILTFEEPDAIEQFAAAKQARMDRLMASMNNLSSEDLVELRGLVDEAEAIARGNARRIASRKRRLQRNAVVKPVK